MGEKRPFSPYHREVLAKCNGEFLAKVFISINIDKDGTCKFKIPAKRIEDFVKLKHLLEFKYCMPVIMEQEDGNKYLKFPPYSAFKLLSLIQPHTSNHVGYKNKGIKAAINKCKDIPMKFYLAGPIEKCEDMGRSFRKHMRECMQFTNSVLIDPCDFQYNKDNVSLTKFKQNNSLKKAYWYARKIVVGDISVIRQVDAILLWIDERIGSGSISESTVGVYDNKPVYAVLSKDYKVEQVNPWLLGCVTRVFPHMHSFRNFFLRF